VAAELKASKKNYEKSVSAVRERQKRLDAVKSERVQLFMRCYDHISAEIDSIYKVLSIHFILLIRAWTL